MIKERIKLYLWLTGVNLFISAFTFGGGYVVVPMIRKYFVTGKGIFSERELMEMAAIAQSSPGAIAINLSVLAGKRTAGIAGAVISCLASILPPILILSLVSRWYTAFAANVYIAAALKGMQAGVAALIVDLIMDMYQMILDERSRLLNWLVPFTFIGCVLGGNVIMLLLVSSVICIVSLYLKNGKREIEE